MKTPQFKKYIRKGFTLIELMVVIVILAALGSIVYFAYCNGAGI